VLRIIEEEAMKDSTAKIVAQLPVEAATFLLNEKRQAIRDVELRLDVEIIIVPSTSLVTPHYRVQRVRLSEAEQEDHKKASYLLSENEEDLIEARSSTDKPRPMEKPAVQQVVPDKPVPSTRKKTGKGLISRLFGSLFGVPEKGKETPVDEQSRNRNNQQRRRRPPRNRDRNRTNNPGNRQRQKSGGRSKNDNSSSNDGNKRRDNRNQDGNTNQQRQRSSSKSSANRNRSSANQRNSNERSGQNNRRRSNQAGSSGEDKVVEQQNVNPEKQSANQQNQSPENKVVDQQSLIQETEVVNYQDSDLRKETINQQSSSEDKQDLSNKQAPVHSVPALDPHLDIPEVAPATSPPTPTIEAPLTASPAATESSSEDVTRINPRAAVDVKPVQQANPAEAVAAPELNATGTEQAPKTDSATNKEN